MTAVLPILFSATPSFGEPLWPDVCNTDEEAKRPYCDTKLKLEERVADYVRRIPVEAQIAMMGNTAAGFEPLNIPPYQWWSEGLHGPLEPCVTWKDQCSCATSFPSPSLLGNSFNRSLYQLIGQAIGTEGLAISKLRPHNSEIGDG